MVFVFYMNSRKMYTEDTETPVEFDLFRHADKCIKAYYKQTNAKDNQSKGYWKRKTSDEFDFDWNDVVDPYTLTDNEAVITESTFNFFDHAEYSTNVKVLRLKNAPEGLYVITNLLPPESQLYWSRKALVEYSKEDHTNLTNLQKSADEIVTWDDVCSTNIEFHDFLKLRWSCLGYHYDWTARKYQKNLKSHFPADFAHLCRKIAQLVTQDFEPEAAIVNYYPLTSSMGGHLDDAEHTLEKPIVSLSLGCSAIFLIGGRTKNIKPIPVLVRSGDVVIMTGESRCCYHGVPCIFPATFSPLIERNQQLNIETSGSLLRKGSPAYHALPKEDQRVVDFLNEARLNLNVRQVRVDATSDDSWVEKAGTGCVKLANYTSNSSNSNNCNIALTTAKSTTQPH